MAGCQEPEDGIGRTAADCIGRGLVFGWHPGFHHAAEDPRRAYWVPQETGWWCRRMDDAGMDTESFPTLREALDDFIKKAGDRT